jgi:dihydrodipicolinate synthase/N-acetylneuraminate lyase
VKTTPVEPADLAAVMAVPPLARRADAERSLDLPATRRLVDHVASGGVRSLLFGGNAFLHHITLVEYEELLSWMAALPDPLWPIPSVGPSFGRAIDQAVLLRRQAFPCVMALPCGDPRDAAGLERGWREFVQRSGVPLMLYLKDEHTLGPEVEAGLDVVGRLMADGTAVALKYAIVREAPEHDRYLEGLLARVPRECVVSGIGERPAIAHMERFGLPGFTTGSGCLAPASSTALHEACVRRAYDEARALREDFLPHENLRDAWGPARVLHASVELSGICATGPIPPYVSPLDAERLRTLGPVARALRGAKAAVRRPRTA